MKYLLTASPTSSGRQFPLPALSATIISRGRRSTVYWRLQWVQSLGRYRFRDLVGHRIPSITEGALNVPRRILAELRRRDPLW